MAETKSCRVLGLTGTYCAGKNHVARLLEKRGFPVLDVDKLGHQVIEAEKEAVLARFGADLRGEDGKIDRKRLGARVFGRPGELAALEALVHPAANRMTAEWIARREEQGSGPGVINAALLLRSSALPRLEGIIIVRAPWFTRLLRAKRRDRLPWKALIRRFGSQRGFESQYFNKNFTGEADIYIIENRGYSALFSRFFERRLEHRIDQILSVIG
ncbi:MAG: dephospho-CoA kinase [Treponema sp.]|jgi:dephospho-CoA kinase|nr:dephospho-CoA kinase [Treponema sp.]